MPSLSNSSGQKKRVSKRDDFFIQATTQYKNYVDFQNRNDSDSNLLSDSCSLSSDKGKQAF